MQDHFYISTQRWVKKDGLGYSKKNSLNWTQKWPKTTQAFWDETTQSKVTYNPTVGFMRLTQHVL